VPIWYNKDKSDIPQEMGKDTIYRSKKILFPKNKQRKKRGKKIRCYVRAKKISSGNGGA